MKASAAVLSADKELMIFPNTALVGAALIRLRGGDAGTFFSPDMVKGSFQRK